MVPRCVRGARGGPGP
ncbi:hypothetical protein Nmel_014057 [Mimus melanotis]